MGEEGGVPRSTSDTEEVVGSGEGGDGLGRRSAGSGERNLVGFVVVGTTGSQALLFQGSNKELGREEIVGAGRNKNGGDGSSHTITAIGAKGEDEGTATGVKGRATIDAFDCAGFLGEVLKQGLIVDDEGVGTSVYDELGAVGIGNEGFGMAFDGRDTWSAFRIGVAGAAER